MTSTMAAAVYYGAHDIRIEDVAVPVPAPGEALIRVTRSGICGTDATEWVAGPKTFPVAQRHPASGHLGPLIPGHEFVGEVAAVNEVTNFAVGDLVASGAGIWCGRCPRCREGRTNLCRNYRTLGLNVNGAMAQYVAVPAQTLRAVPAGMSPDHAALAQPLAVGIHAARRCRARDGDQVVVIGAGAIGSFVLAGLRHLADVEVTVIDFPGPRLDRAARFGAARTLAPSPTIAADVTDLLDGRRPDVVIEASGAPGQLDAAMHMVADGGRVLAVGIPKAQPEIDLRTMVFREITLDSTLAHICDADLPAALTVLAEGQLGDELAENPVPLSDLGPSLDRLATGQVEGKILIDPTR
jgi:(R,R)-butanediol dehydrogenase / meso-butanediol dehydrogenase / diacetyl reductase